MELAISAVTGELVSRFISFLINKYRSHVGSEEKVERLQHLLMRARTVVEEADGRYITNSGMLMQLKVLSEAMYRGYHILDSFRYRLCEDAATDEVSDPDSLPLAIPLKRSCTVAISGKGKIPCLELNCALQSLEAAVANLTEFLVLLGGCERMSRKPYDMYLYIDNFLFGRHIEKQRILNFLLQHNPPGAPAVLPIVGGSEAGKKTLVAHVCNDERVRLRFSSSWHLNGENFLRILEHEKTMSGTTLVVVEFAKDINDEDWKTFYSFLSCMNHESKVIIITKLVSLARFGSVKPIFLNSLSYEEFRYLFQTLAFGSANPSEHPQLVQVAEDLAKELHLIASLVAVNAIANVLRNNLNVQTWLSILSRFRRMVKKNLSADGVHPKLLVEQGQPVDITDFSLHHAAPPISVIHDKLTHNVSVKKELPKLTLGEFLVDPNVKPKEEFILLLWESRIPPYTSFVHFVRSCAQDKPEGTPLSGRKRRKVPI